MGSRTHHTDLARVSRPQRHAVPSGPCCQCAEQELNLQSSKAGGLQPLGPANAQSTHVVQVARVRVELTDDHEGLSFAALPVCVPRRVVKASPMGFEPTISCVTGRRALQAAPRGRSFSCSSSGGIRTHSIPGSKPRWSASCLPSRMCPDEESNLESRGFKPSRSASWRTWALHK